jgi:hypothetical protein
MNESIEIKLNYLQRRVFNQYMEEGEKVVYMIQNHILLLMYPISLFFVLNIPVIYAWYKSGYNPFVFLGALATFLLSGAYFGLRWYNWYADCMILTDKNIIVIQWDSLVKIKYSRISYRDVESAIVTIEGFWYTLFGIGDVEIQTANESFNPKLIGAQNAKEAEKQVLMNKEIYINRYESNEPEIFKKALREIMDEYFNKDKEEDDCSKNPKDHFNFSKYRISGERFHMTDAKINQNSEDLKPDRYEKYRLNKDLKKRFDKYRRDDGDSQKKYD